MFPNVNIYSLSITYFLVFVNIFIFYFMCVCMCTHTRVCALACMGICASHVSSTQGGQKCALSPLELELQLAVIHHEDSGI